MKKPQRKSVLNLSSSKACKFFIKHKSYCNFDLPPYILFDKILKEVNSLFKKNKSLSDFQLHDPKNRDKINHTIFHNKNGRYAWRPMQLIHPALYVSLVHEITKKKNWKPIRERFKKFKKPPHIKCMSIPVVSPQKKKDKPEQILSWWKDVEQQSITMSLDYEYLTHVDISNCYGSIYTHSIPWAIHGKKKAKKDRRKRCLVGNIIDERLRQISYGQTNGIPQGSVLMDFIAEMVLGYIDCELAKKIKKTKIKYDIIRYRDDYRIFTNNLSDGEQIVKIISEVLIDFGMTLNPNKTKPNSQVITGSIKPDKLYWLRQKQKATSLQKHLLLIHHLSIRFPHSGSLMKALGEFYDKLPKHNKKDTEEQNKEKEKNITSILKNIYQLISIIVDIAYHNPKTYSTSAAILSQLISYIDNEKKQTTVIKKIVKKFKKLPNTGYLDIWLQRVVKGFGGDRAFNEPICKLVDNKKNVLIWKSKWLKEEHTSKIKAEMIIDKKELRKIRNKPIDRKEFAVFPPNY